MSLRVVVVAGPTACRKTELGLELAARLGGEIVCADSVQLLEGFQIGSAAPTSEERSRAPHHLFHAFPPEQPPDAGAYQRAADAVLAEIAARGRLPILVGGTGLYLRALLDGLAEIPPVPLLVRERLRAELEAAGVEVLWSRLVAADPTTAQAIQGGPRNTQRVLRALEVFEGTGTPMSTWHARQTRGRGYSPVVLVPEFPLDVLGPRLDARLEAMLAHGFLAEVEGLLARGLQRGDRAMKSLGYAELAAHLAGELPLAAAIEAIRRGHRAYAKRQRTWFRAVEGRHVLDAGSSQLVDHALAALSGAAGWG